MTRHLYLFGVICLLLLAPLTATAADNSKDKPDLADQDCAKCHTQQVQAIDEQGAAHSGVGCLNCHPEHPPFGKETITECALCHFPDEKQHYQLENCSSCHNPHKPLAIDFSSLSETKPACLSCHPDIGKEMKAHPSAHSAQDCNMCHQQHGLEEGQYLNCLDCHSGHSKDMTNADCTKCHKPHSPKEVTYSESLESSLCASCHGQIGKDLAQSNMAHSQFNCAFCHAGSHGQIIPCSDCHGANLHGDYMHQEFPQCLQCHKDAHALAE